MFLSHHRALGFLRELVNMQVPAPPPHRDGDSVDMVQGGARNLRLKNTPPPQIPKRTTVQRATKIQARREGKHRPRNESELRPR